MDTYQAKSENLSVIAVKWDRHNKRKINELADKAGYLAFTTRSANGELILFSPETKDRFILHVDHYLVLNEEILSEWESEVFERTFVTEDGSCIHYV